MQKNVEVWLQTKGKAEGVITLPALRVGVQLTNWVFCRRNEPSRDSIAFIASATTLGDAAQRLKVI
jgi:hypothetical protein